MAVRVAEDPKVLLRLMLLQRRAQGASPFGLRLQVIDLQVQVRLHLLSARALRPRRRSVIGLQLEAETGAFLVWSLQTNPFRLSIDFLPAEQGPVEVGQRGRIGSTENKGTERCSHVSSLAPTLVLTQCGVPSSCDRRDAGQYRWTVHQRITEAGRLPALGLRRCAAGDAALKARH